MRFFTADFFFAVLSDTAERYRVVLCIPRIKLDHGNLGSCRVIADLRHLNDRLIEPVLYNVWRDR